MYNPSKEDLRHVLLYKFQKGSTVSSAAKSFQNTFENNVINLKTCRRWLLRFKKRNNFTQEVGAPKALNLRNCWLSLSRYYFNYYQTETLRLSKLIV